MNVFGAKFLIMGGKYNCGCFNDVFVFDTNALEWEQPKVLGSVPPGR